MADRAPRIRGADVHRNRLRRMKSQYLQDPLNAQLYAVGEAIRADAQASIREGAVSGPGHRPSPPGEPPNADTRNLDMSIDVRLSDNRKTVQVFARAHYAAAQEYGTARLPARPYLRPALQRNRAKAVQATVQAVRSTVRVYKWSPRGIISAAWYIVRGGTRGF